MSGPSYDSEVVGAKLAARRFKSLISADVNEETGGIGWWSVYPLWPTQRAELSHYFVSIVGAVSTNLDESAAHLHHYRDRVGAENQHLTHRHQAAGGRVPDLRHRTELERLRLVMVRAEQAAFFRSIGSVLDTLAGVVIATGALKMDLLKADLGQLRVGSDSPLYPRIPGQAGGSLRRALDRDGTAGGAAQESFMQSIRAAVTHAGPTGWLQWTLGTRNHFIHRSRWMDLLVRDWPNRRKLPVWVRPLPRSPSAGEGSSLNNAETVSDSYLTEDATTTMEGVLLSVDAVAKAVFECSSSLWALRRSDPFLLFQPGTQWQGQEYATQFAGYRPDTALAAFQAADAVVLNPVDSARLAALARSKERRL